MFVTKQIECPIDFYSKTNNTMKANGTSNLCVNQNFCLLGELSKDVYQIFSDVSTFKMFSFLGNACFKILKMYLSITVVQLL